MEPPAMPLDGPDLDALYELPFMRLEHPSYKERVPGFATIKDSIIVSRGCAGGCIRLRERARARLHAGWEDL